jgi:Glycine rich protein
MRTLLSLFAVACIAVLIAGCGGSSSAGPTTTVPTERLGATKAAAVTETFNYTGSAQTWTVPYGVTSAAFDLYGAEGRGFDVVGSRVRGGDGGHSLATIAVTPNSTIRVMVGGVGVAHSGGFNGGGNAVYGGGGATDVRIGGTALTDRTLVAGGGGGGGAACIGSRGSAFGGNGGGVNGWAGSDPQCGISPGAAGTQSAGGSNGGSLGQGGSGVGGGSGGGGGYYGGGGGNGGPGGGGSSSGPPGYRTESGVRDGNGVATVTYEVTQKQTLRTSSVGTGDGYVSSSPVGIDCGFEGDASHDVCFHDFGEGQPVTVTAHPAAGTVLDQWIYGACKGSTKPTCTTIVSTTRTLSARFKTAPAPSR